MGLARKNRVEIKDPDVLKEINECVEIIKGLGYSIDPIPFVSYKATSTLGKAEGIKGTHIKRVCINEAIFKDKPVLRRTILHELAHIVAGLENNHNRIWLQVVYKISQKTGIKINRLSKKPDYMNETKTTKYSVQCLGCKQVISRVRLSPVITRCFAYKCGHCGGDFKRIK